jgi:hypothetical protein
VLTGCVLAAPSTFTVSLVLGDSPQVCILVLSYLCVALSLFWWRSFLVGVGESVEEGHRNTSFAFGRHELLKRKQPEGRASCDW